MTGIRSMETAGVDPQQLADIDHHRFPDIPYIE